MSCEQIRLSLGWACCSTCDLSIAGVPWLKSLLEKFCRAGGQCWSWSGCALVWWKMSRDVLLAWLWWIAWVRVLRSWLPDGAVCLGACLPGHVVRPGACFPGHAVCPRACLPSSAVCPGVCLPWRCGSVSCWSQRIWGVSVCTVAEGGIAVESNILQCTSLYRCHTDYPCQVWGGGPGGHYGAGP